MRHEEQTEADRQRRITESFSKAAEQLGNDKLEVRLGGIYTMERIARESPEDYWPVMETLSAFVRENARCENVRWQEPDRAAEPRRLDVPTDIAAVLSVICRRDPVNHEREKQMGWSFDLRGTDLRHAKLSGAYLQGAALQGVNLELAALYETHLEGANLDGAHLKEAILYRTHFEGARLVGAHLEGALLQFTHLEGADLRCATALSEAQLADASGDASTRLPEGVTRPAAWPPAKL
ncbi:pentapeptide repeat-containing protein [Paraburkholderia fungorum]|uniref:pentapeptide repeat-containing protein n=1 Tax=Paraburkholderia fungorum TaxID=134537 RepID=UPI0038BAD94C